MVCQICIEEEFSIKSQNRSNDFHIRSNEIISAWATGEKIIQIVRPGELVEYDSHYYFVCFNVKSSCL